MLVFSVDRNQNFISFIMTQQKTHFYFHFHLYFRDVTSYVCQQYQQGQDKTKGWTQKSTFISMWNGPLQVDRVIEEKWGDLQTTTRENSFVCHNLPPNVPKLAEKFY